jgi:hypothetical protein
MMVLINLRGQCAAASTTVVRSFFPRSSSTYAMSCAVVFLSQMQFKMYPVQEGLWSAESAKRDTTIYSPIIHSKSHENALGRFRDLSQLESCAL